MFLSFLNLTNCSCLIVTVMQLNIKGIKGSNNSSSFSVCPFACIAPSFKGDECTGALALNQHLLVTYQNKIYTYYKDTCYLCTLKPRDEVGCFIEKCHCWRLRDGQVTDCLSPPYTTIVHFLFRTFLTLYYLTLVPDCSPKSTLSEIRELYFMVVDLVVILFHWLVRRKFAAGALLCPSSRCPA